MQRAVKKIAILGPESSGKSVLCQQLAMHYNTLWVPEYARTYLPSLTRPYHAGDLLILAREQKRREDELLEQANRFLFCDTELINLRQWCLHKFGFCHDWIEEQLKKKPYDFYLLTDADMPWEADPLRENPGKGHYFFEVYKNDIELFGFSYSIVKGEGAKRLQCAIQSLEQWERSFG
jgi:NadR type nicotinamide-nucleotide adenylyltransferase